MKLDLGRILFLILLLTLSAMPAMAGNIKGTELDKQTKEPLTGATVQIEGTAQGVAADIDGAYTREVKDGTYTVVVRYIGYRDISLPNVKVKGNTELNFEMESDAQALSEVSVTAVAKKNNEVALMQEQRRSLVVQSGVSAQQIAKTQDKDASEVIKRVPGVSIIDEKFVMVRGLSQRYNNVWMNGSAVPSSEADSRAFSFDIIPSSQLDNMVIVKSPAPEYPADFTGGFILINTTYMPGSNSFNISVGTSINDQTHFKDFVKSKGSGMDWLGFGSGFRSLDAGMKGKLNMYPGYDTGNNPRVDVLNNGFHNDWTLKTINPWGDLKLNMAYNHVGKPKRTHVRLLAAVNYSNSYKTFLDWRIRFTAPTT